MEILAEEACCTPSHLSHLFRNLLDTSAILYLHKVRIHEAVKKLNSGEEVKDVAYAVGYSSMNNFTNTLNCIEERLLQHLKSEDR